MKFKKYSTATDTYTTLPATFQASGADVENYQVYGANSGVGEETENLVPEISTANGWRPGYYSAINGYVSNNSNGEWLSPLIDIGSMTSVTITYKRLAEGTSPSETISFFDSNGNFISNKTDSTNAHATFNDFPSGASKFCYAFRSYCFTEQEIIENEMLTCCVSGSTAPTTYVPFGYKIPISLESGVTENLFDKNEITENYYINENGEIMAYNGFGYSDPMPVSSGNYAISNLTKGDGSGWSCRMHGYDADGNWVRQIKVVAVNDALMSSSFIVDSDITDIRISIKFINGQNLNVLMITPGSTAPDHYIPHRYESNYDLFIGDNKLYEDECLDFDMQKIITNTETTVFTGAENNWHYYGRYGDAQVQTFYYDFSESQSLDDFLFLTCNKYETTQDHYVSGARDLTTRYQYVSAATHYTCNLNRVYFFDNRFDSVDSFKEHLQDLYSSGNPLIIIRQTVTSESKDPPAPFPALHTYIGENNISVDTTVQPDKVVLTVAAWREIEAKKYVNGSWTDIVVRRYENGAWVPSPPVQDINLVYQLGDSSYSDGFIKEDGTISPNRPDWQHNELFEIEPSTTYIFSYVHSSTRDCSVSWYTENRQFIRTDEQMDNTLLYEYTSPSNAKYASISVKENSTCILFAKKTDVNLVTLPTNPIDGVTWKQGWIQSDGTINSNSDYMYYSEEIDVSDCDSMFVTYKDRVVSANYFEVLELDENGQKTAYLDERSISDDLLTLNANTKKIRFSCSRCTNVIIVKNDYYYKT